MRLGAWALAWTALLLAGCGEAPRDADRARSRGPARERSLAGTAMVKTGAAWFEVTPGASAEIAGEPVWGVGFPGEMPQVSTEARVVLPEGASSAEAERGWIVVCVLDGKGRIARAQIVLGPDTPELRSAVVTALRRFGFVPAMLDGKSVCIRYTITLYPEGWRRPEPR